MTPLVPITLFGWIPVVLVMFALLPARRAVLASFFVSWLFLPCAGFDLEGLPTYSKLTATSYGVMLGIALFDVGRLMSFRPRWIDLPMVAWCLVPILSSVSNGYGIYDGLSAALNIIVTFCVPYFAGRLYLGDWIAQRELAIAFVIGGLVYAPLCWYEARMSPQLHTMLYGFHQHSFLQSYRGGGGWRPVVFMQHGIMVGTWMMAATLVGAALWRGKSLTRLFHMPIGFLVLLLGVTTVLCRSVGAIVLLGVGAATLVATRRFRRPAIIGALACAPFAYAAIHVAGIGETVNSALVSLAEPAGPDRVASLEYRLHNEQLLLRRALEQPLFGWAGWGGNRVVEGDEGSVTDGMWIIYIGVYGIAGFLALYLWLSGPVVVAAWKLGALNVPREYAAAPVGLALVLALFVVDSIPNSMPNPIFFVAAGAMASLAVSLPRRRPHAASAPALRQVIPLGVTRP